MSRIAPFTIASTDPPEGSATIEYSPSKLNTIGLLSAPCSALSCTYRVCAARKSWKRARSAPRSAEKCWKAGCKQCDGHPRV